MLSRIRALLRYKGYKVFTRPYELNIVGLRQKSTIPNRFDDELHVFYRTGDVSWHYHVFNITTDPGTFWLKNPMQEKGTAILAEGQNMNAYALGLHKGQYKALVQIRPVTVIRDYDRDAILDFFNGVLDTGNHSINIHRANSVGTTKTVDKNSAGCQVFENATDFAKFLLLCEKHRSLYGNLFSYTLIDFRSWNRQNLRWFAYVMSFFVGTGVAGHFLIKHLEKRYE